MENIITDEKLVGWAYKALAYKMQNNESLNYLKSQLPLPKWDILNHPKGKVLKTTEKEILIILFDNRMETLEFSISSCLLKKPEYK